jgi:hypothetical protein
VKKEGCMKREGERRKKDKKREKTRRKKKEKEGEEGGFVNSELILHF